MGIWHVVVFGLVLLAIVVGGYVYMFFHIMRRDPRELEFRKKIGQDDRLVPPREKKIKN